MKGVTSHGRICTSVLWTLFFAFLLVRGDDFLEQGMCLIKLKLNAIFCPIRLLCVYCFNFRICVRVLRCSCEI
jgi:hypothetical protein